MAISSIHLKPAKLFSISHNSRTTIVSYLILDSKNNESNRSPEEAYARYFALYREAISNYMKRTGQKVQTRDEKMVWEAVVNLNPEHTLANLKELTELLHKTYGWQEIMTTIHRDEGHIDETTGKVIINHHAHIILFMLSKDGIFRFKKRDFGKKQMAMLQTQVAHILKMKRGESKMKTKRIRYDHQQYRQWAKEKESLMQDVEIWKYNFELAEDSMVEGIKRIDNLKAQNKKLSQKLEDSKYANSVLDGALHHVESEHTEYTNRLKEEIDVLKKKLERYEKKKPNGAPKIISII